MKKGLSQILLVAAALGTTSAFTPARGAAVAGVAINKAAGFEVVAHGLVALMAFGAVWKSNFGRPTPSMRRVSTQVHLHDVDGHVCDGRQHATDSCI